MVQDHLWQQPTTSSSVRTFRPVADGDEQACVHWTSRLLQLLCCSQATFHVCNALQVRLAEQAVDDQSGVHVQKDAHTLSLLPGRHCLINFPSCQKTFNFEAAGRLLEPPWFDLAVPSMPNSSVKVRKKPARFSAVLKL